MPGRHPKPPPGSWHSVHTRLNDADFDAVRIVAAMEGVSVLELAREGVNARVRQSPHFSRLPPAKAADPSSPSPTAQADAPETF